MSTKIGDAIKSGGEGLFKLTFGQIPFIGPLVNEFTYDYRGRIVQNRLNLFSELLHEFFAKYAEGILDLDKMQKEDFHDLFVYTLQRVAETKSEEKLKLFRNVIVNNQKAEGPIELSRTFLDLTVKLQTVQIVMLERIKGASDDSENLQRDLQQAKENQSAAQVKLLEEKWKEQQGGISALITASKFEVDDRTFTVLLADLQSKGLVSRVQYPVLGGIANGDYRISDLGVEYLNFVGSFED
jgi:hypothetical protein